MTTQQQLGGTGPAGTPLATANLALKFLLELAAVALLAYWGAATGSGVWAVVLAVLAPTAMIVVWARFAAPRAPGRLPTRLRIPLELGVFAIAAIAGYVAGAVVAAVVFAVLAIANAVGLSALRQWAS